MARTLRARLSYICCAIAVLVGWVFLCASPVPAQEKHRFTYKASGENTKYTKQHMLDVGDIPGHQIRIFEIHRTHPADNPLVFEGISVQESWERSFSDYVNWSGRHWGYGIRVMENGDKIFFKMDGTTHVAFLPDGGRKGTYWGLSTISGGTGNFKGIRGGWKYTGIFNPTTGLNETTMEIEYWME